MDRVAFFFDGDALKPLPQACSRRGVALSIITPQRLQLDEA